MRTQSHSLQPRHLNRDRAMLPRPPCSERSTTPSRPSREAFLSRRWATDRHGCFHISFISIPSPCLLACLPACLRISTRWPVKPPSPHARDNPLEGHSISPTSPSPKNSDMQERESKWALIEGKTGRFRQAIGLMIPAGFWRPHGASE